MISNKTITIAAVGFASANALALQAKLRAQVESENIFDDIADWTVGAANDIADWTEGAVSDAADWTEQAFTDAGNWTAGAFTDAYDWVKEGDNWEALGKTLLGATITGFKGDWEGGWDLFTDSSMYYGDTYDEIDAKKKQQEDFVKAMNAQAAECAKFEPKVGQPTTPGGYYNYTMDVNYQLMMSGVPLTAIYGAFGDIEDPNHQMMDMRACEREDCMNPCYGQNQYGACYKCTTYMMDNEGARHEVCDLCELGQESTPYSG